MTEQDVHLTEQEFNENLGANPKRKRLNYFVNLANKYRKSQPEKALSYAERGLDLAIQLRDRVAQVDFYNTMGWAYCVQHKLEKAYGYLREALQILNRHLTTDTTRFSTTYNHIAGIYFYKSNFDLALEYMLKALDCSEPAMQPLLFNNIGDIYLNMGDTDRALEYFSNGLVIAKEREDIYAHLHLLYNLGYTYLEQKEFSKPLVYFHSALQIIHKQKQDSYRFIHASILLELGSTYKERGEYSQAVNYLQKALDISTEYNHTVIKCQALTYLGQVYLLKERTDKFIELQEKGLNMAKKNNLLLAERHCLRELRDYYVQVKDYKNGYIYTESLLDLENREKEQLRQHNIGSLLKKRERDILDLEEKNKKISRQNRELEQFAHIVAHDLKEPLRNITSFVNLIDRRYSHELSDLAQEYMQYVEDGTRSMNRKLEDLLEYVTLQVKTEKVVIVDANQIVEETIQYMIDKINDTNTQIELQTLPSVRIIPTHLRMILFHLISNSIKFRDEGKVCQIHISGEKKDRNWILKIKDNGIGISKEYHKKVLRIFNRLDKKHTDGTGIGLAICDKIAHLYYGNVQIDSTLGEGTTINITIPLSKNMKH